jgi:hypothetical protein
LAAAIAEELHEAPEKMAAILETHPLIAIIDKDEDPLLEGFPGRE